MNTQGFFFVFISIFLTIAVEADLETARKERVAAAAQCKQELNITGEDYKIMYIKEVPKNEAQSCFLECLCKKLGLFKDGKLDHEGFIQSIKLRFGEDKNELDKAEELFKKCEPEVDKGGKSENCGGGKAMRSCVIEHFRDRHDLHNKSLNV